MKFRNIITKNTWEHLGGFKNSDLYRQQVNGRWYYYSVVNYL